MGHQDQHIGVREVGRTACTCPQSTEEERQSASRTVPACMLSRRTLVCQNATHVGECTDRLIPYLARACVSNTPAMRMPCW